MSPLLRANRLRWLAIALVVANVALYAWQAQRHQSVLRELPSARQPLPEGTPSLQLLSERKGETL